MVRGHILEEKQSLYIYLVFISIKYYKLNYIIMNILTMLTQLL